MFVWKFCASLSWQHDLLLVSGLAAIVGLLLLLLDTPAQDERSATERGLLLMSFGYWLVYCVSVGLRHLPCDTPLVVTNIKILGALAYLLTFTCILSLPLHKFSLRRQAE